MARPIKEGLDYFSIDTDISNDPKVEFLEAKHGLYGYAIMLKLLERIYRSGYYLNWGKREETIFSGRVKVDINSINDYINTCLDEGIFNKTLHETYAILTSKGIQKRYLSGTIKRKAVSIFKDFLLLTPKEAREINPKIVIVDINPIKVDINPIKVDINPAQPELKDTSVHKVKESKVKESKVKNIYMPENSGKGLNALEITFEKFYKNYPRKVSKLAAKKAWEKLKPNSALIEEILIALEKQKQSFDWKKKDGQFIPHPATWINGHKWEDETDISTDQDKNDDLSWWEKEKLIYAKSKEEEAEIDAYREERIREKEKMEREEISIDEEIIDEAL